MDQIRPSEVVEGPKEVNRARTFATRTAQNLNSYGSALGPVKRQIDTIRVGPGSMGTATKIRRAIQLFDLLMTGVASIDTRQVGGG